MASTRSGGSSAVDAENLPGLGEPDLPTACLQEGENANEGEQFRGQHDEPTCGIIA